MRIVKAPATVQLLEADPDLGALLSDARLLEAERELTVRTYQVPAGTWDVARLSGTSVDHVGLLILDGGDRGRSVDQFRATCRSAR